jgi:hypothetical protein
MGLDYPPPLFPQGSLGLRGSRCAHLCVALSWETQFQYCCSLYPPVSACPNYQEKEVARHATACALPVLHVARSAWRGRRAAVCWAGLKIPSHPPPPPTHTHTCTYVDAQPLLFLWVRVCCLLLALTT